MKLIQTKDYLLLIDEEAEIKDYNIVYNYDLDVVWEMHPHGLPTENTKTVKCIAYHPLTKEAEEFDLPLLPPFEDKFEELFDTIDDIKVRYATEESDLWIAYRNGFKDCFEAQSKQFSLEDMLDAFEYGLSKSEFQLTRKLKEDFNNFIQSLSTQKFPSEFIPEYEINKYSAYGHNTHMLKTITNSEGKEVLVGTYKY